ncbi:DASH family cryptochrome [Maribacter antarcticus]|uniref:DASH family cryptochrome n=1 Tax=Maribacter antarcticus TaxID=505250 RepID=UPI00047A820A|nr:DASH family cryptochrome [Maribacter antarcticus]
MNNLVWFRNDLRVQDNTSLLKALTGEKVIGVYCFDDTYFKKDEFGFNKTEKFRAQFLIETITQLESNLKALNIPLFIYIGDSGTHIPQLIKEHQITRVYLQKEWTRDENNILANVKAHIPSNIAFEETLDQFLFHPKDIPYPNFNTIPEVFTNFRKKCEKEVSVKPCIVNDKILSKENFLKTNTSIPTLSELNLEEFNTDSRSAFPFHGGENEALKRIAHYFWETKKLAYYKKTRNGLVGSDYSSKLSPWLANGSISARTIYWEVRRFEKEVKKNQDTYWLIFELIWRDYFKYVSLKHQNNIFKIGGILEKEYDWHTTKIAKQEWIRGNTNEPFVNANMKELAITGWMSNRGRQNVASFWAKELKQDWRIGAAYFESMLLDYDVHSNWGNWMYNSGVGNDPRDRKFNIARQADMYDGQGKFQRLWGQDSLF